VSSRKTKRRISGTELNDLLVYQVVVEIEVESEELVRNGRV
jgi:hypothetical protein